MSFQNRNSLLLRSSGLPTSSRASAANDAGVSLKYMLDFGANPIERQLILSAQFLHNELPVRLAHRVAELENLPFGLSAKPPVLKARALAHICPPQNLRMSCLALPRSGSPHLRIIAAVLHQ